MYVYIYIYIYIYTYSYIWSTGFIDFILSRTPGGSRRFFGDVCNDNSSTPLASDGSGALPRVLAPLER